MARRGLHLPDLGSSAGPPELNLTPLIDVVFVVLICFILIAPLLEIEQIELASGSSTRPLHSQDRSALRVHLRADNSIQINNINVEGRHVSRSLRQWCERTGNQPPQLFCDRRAHFGAYQSLKASMEECGFTGVDLIVMPTGREPGELP